MSMAIGSTSLLDGPLRMELCISELLAEGEDDITAESHISRILRLVSTSERYVETCFDLLQGKLHRSSYQWKVCLKVLILLHRLLQDNMWLDGDSKKKARSCKILDRICSNGSNSFVCSYCNYLAHILENPIPLTSFTMLVFMEKFSVFEERVNLFVKCKFFCSSEACGSSRLALSAVDMLMKDGYVLYQSLRNVMDKLLDAMVDIESPYAGSAGKMHVDAMNLGQNLMHYFTFAYGVALDRESEATSVLAKLILNENEAAANSLFEDATCSKVDEHAHAHKQGDEQLDPMERVLTELKNLAIGQKDLVKGQESLSKGQKDLIKGQEDNTKSMQNLMRSQQDITKSVRSLLKDHHAGHLLQGFENIPENVLEARKAQEDALRNLRQLIRHDIQSATSVQAFKTNMKLDKVDRHLGAFHEKLCRALLGRNMRKLINVRSELEGFASFDARLSRQFVSVGQICDHLQLTHREYATVESSLLHDMRSDTVGTQVLSSFLLALINELEKQFSSNREKWPKYALRIEESTKDVVKKLPQPFMIPEIIQLLKSIKDLGKSNRKLKEDNLWMLFDHVDHVAHLLHVSEIQHNTRAFAIMKESWGLLVLFWVLKRRFRHALLEVDVCGSVARSGSSWEVCFGEIKSSDGVAMEKGTRQLSLLQEVYEHILNAAVPKYTCKVTKCLFMVHTTQGKVLPLVHVEGDVFVVDISQLPY